MNLKFIKLIGMTVQGFKFGHNIVYREKIYFGVYVNDGTNKNILLYMPSMDSLINKKGEIINVYNDGTCSIKFHHNENFFRYPIKGVISQISWIKVNRNYEAT